MSSVKVAVRVLAPAEQEKARRFSSTESDWEWAARIRLTFQVCHSSRRLTLACENKAQIHGARILLSKLERDCNQERMVRLNVYFYINKLSCREILGLNQQWLWFSSLHGDWSWWSVKQSEYLVFISPFNPHKNPIRWLYDQPRFAEEKTEAVELSTTCLTSQSWQMGRIEARCCDSRAGSPEPHRTHTWEGKHPGPGPFDLITLSLHTLTHLHTPLSPQGFGYLHIF